MLLHIFPEKIRNFPGVHFKDNHCLITLTDKIVLTSIIAIKRFLSKNICSSLFISNQSEIQIETLEQ